GKCMLCMTGKQHICKDMKILGVHIDGAFAEYVKIPEICAWKLSNDISPEIGAIYEPFAIAIHGVLKDKIGGCSTIISGCGPIGLFAIGVASTCGANQVFAIDINDFRLNIAKKMGNNVIPLNPLKDNIIDFSAIGSSIFNIGIFTKGLDRSTTSDTEEHAFKITSAPISSAKIK
ncbi:unnamed protein product, partial [marine sediment metagenome]